MPTDQTPRPPMTPRTKTFVALLVAAGIVGAGAFTVQAVADSRTFQHMSTGLMHNAAWSHHGGKRFSELSDAEIEQRIDRIVRHVAIEIDATDEQSEKIVALMTAVAMDMKPLREKMLDSREQLHDLLLADRIDRPALEALRVERLAEIDRISKNLVNAIADVAEVLTPEQRRVLDERIKEFRSMFHGHHGGRHRDRS